MSNIVNKVKDAITGGHKDHHHDTTTGTSSTNTNPNYGSTTNTGPHDSKIANKLDPRVDSDNDGSRTGGTGNTGAYGSSDTSYTGTGNTGSYGSTDTGYTGTGNTYSQTSGGHGPHSSGIANRIDPRVDSTTGGANTGPTGTSGTSGFGQSGTSGFGQSGTSGFGESGTSGFGESTTHGPHSSNLANKVDPRVDSDRDGSYAAGTGNTGYGNTGAFGNTGTYGSNTTSTGGIGGLGGTHGHSNKDTTGPHGSDLANKLDPRVDSDLDGSRTAGSGQNYGNY